MNNDVQKIEALLGKAPQPKAPAGLLEKLNAGMVLPQPPQARPAWNSSLPLWKRWLPAFSFSVFFLACLVALGVQSRMLSELRQENQTLQAARPDVEQLRQNHEEFQRLRHASAELSRLRSENLEVQRLRAEAGQLREQLQEVAVLRAENQRLRAERAITGTPVVGAKPDEDFFTKVTERSRSLRCVDNLKQVCLAARIWSNDRKDILPASFEEMTAELGTPKITFCPDNPSMRYTLLSPGATERVPEVVYVRCPIHGHVGQADGSVHQLGDRKPVQRDGKWVIER